MTPFLSAHQELGALTKSVKTLGVRDWLLVVLTMYLVYNSHIVQRQTNALMQSHAMEARPAIQAVIEGDRAQRIESSKISFFLYVQCMRDAANDREAQLYCENALNGLKPVMR